MSKKIAVLTSPESWFLPFAETLASCIRGFGCGCNIYNNHRDIIDRFDIVFILSYFKIIPIEFLQMHSHNVVVHESDLPRGKGWSPLFWQILEGNSRIPVSLFEATEKADAGDIYITSQIELSGNELHEEIRKKQADETIRLCVEYLNKLENLVGKSQSGESSFYPKRTPKDSELDIHKTIDEQFNLLRIVNNEDFPAFFYKNGQKYIIKIFKEENEDS